MIKHIIITLIVFLFPGQMFAQEQDKLSFADSLYEKGVCLINNYTLESTIDDNVLAYHLLSQARDLYHELRNYEKEYECLLQIGECIDYVDYNLQNKLKIFNDALIIADSTDDEYKDIRKYLAYKKILFITNHVSDNKNEVNNVKESMINVATESSDSRSGIVKSLLMADFALQHNQMSRCDSCILNADSLFIECIIKEQSLSYVETNIPGTWLKNSLIEITNNSSNPDSLRLYNFYEWMQEWINSTFESYFNVFYQLYNKKQSHYLRNKQYDKVCEEACHYMDFLKSHNQSLYFMEYAEFADMGVKMDSIEYSYASLDSLNNGISNFPYFEKATEYMWFYYYCLSGRIHALFNDNEIAIDSYRKALEYFDEEELNNLDRLELPDDIDYYLTIRGYIDVLRKNGYYNEALDKCLEFIVFCHNHFNDDSFQYATALKLAGDICLARGNEDMCDMDQAMDYYTRSCDIYEYLFTEWLKNFFYIKDNFWKEYLPVMIHLTEATLTTHHINDNYTTNSYNGLLVSKGCLLEAENSLIKSVYATNDSTIINKFKELESLQLSMKENLRDPIQNEKQIVGIINRMKEIEMPYDSVVNNPDYISFLSLEYNNIIENLEQNEYIVDFLDYKSESNEHQYVAYVFSKEDECPHLMKVFTEEEWNSIRKGKPSYDLYKQPLADRIIDLVWKPLSDLIPEGSTVFFVPSGVLHQLAIESLPINGNYKFIRLSFAREVIKRNPTLAVNYNKNVDAVLYGGLKYDMSGDVMISEHEKYKNSIPSFIASRGDESIGNSGGQGWNELPGTEEEVNAVENVLKDSHNIKKHTGTEGTEESFLSLHGQAPQILLMSTHGFYYTPDDAQKKEYLKGYNDAMSLSGLILSGGNRAWRGETLPDGVLPGILTADKISQMNLKGLDLVVLSACKTGQGDVTAEGIYGLQRAFKKAGAGTIVMTLWNVDDEVTKVFMIKFFRNLKNNGWNKRKAFDEAKEYVRSQKKYEDPYYWAGFVMLD